MFHSAIGFGVAGNFAGHLEQAGESRDFTEVKTEEEDAPKGLFPFYLPKGGPAFLNVYPLTATVLQLPEEPCDLHMEPEVALVCTLRYENGKVAEITPTAFGAYNDATIRKQAPKISVKKNWGAFTKGFSSTLVPIDRFAPGGVMDSWRIASFLLRNGEWKRYGQDSPVLGYSYFYEKLLRWMTEKLGNQHDHGPLEELPALLEAAGRPETAVISIGATRYTEYGETTFLRAGDVAAVVAYDGNLYDPETLFEKVRDQNLEGEGISPLVTDIRES